MPTGTIHKFGTLYVNGTQLENPISLNNYEEKYMYSTYPYKSKIEIRDSLSEEYLLNWIEVNTYYSKLFICDRNIITDITFNELLSFINKPIVVDDEEYILRILLCSKDGDIINNEWILYINNYNNIESLPSENESNDIWNWKHCSSFIDYACGGAIKMTYIAGNKSSDEITFYSKDLRHKNIGFRPVLEKKNNDLYSLKPKDTLTDVMNKLIEFDERISICINRLKEILISKGIECSNTNKISELIEMVNNLSQTKE